MSEIIESRLEPARKSRAFRWMMNGAILLVFTGVLAATAVPNFKRSRERSNIRAFNADVKTVAGALEMYNLDNNVKAAPTKENIQRLVDAGYLQSMPGRADEVAARVRTGDPALNLLPAGTDGIVLPVATPALEPVTPGTEDYARIVESDFLAVTSDPLSTFSVDVDTASYANVRRFLDARQLPPRDAVRVEEMVNYFDYDLPKPDGREPIALAAEVAASPFRPDARVVAVTLAAREVPREERPPTNLVFLIDVSGSMADANKLPLLRQGLEMMVASLRSTDTVSIVVYAGAAGVVLEPTNGSRRERVLEALDRLGAGGSTNGSEGIHLAYDLAKKTFITGGVNRVVLATDGDFNVGVQSHGELVRLIEEKAKSGVFLTVLGLGTGNLQDCTLEELADHGNGFYAYLDTLDEARRVLVDRMSGTLTTVAKDVKIQVEFNPARVASYRLIGYENRRLENRDFKDDAKDAGDIGAGHQVVALYEVLPAGSGTADEPAVDPLKYQTASLNRPPKSFFGVSDEILTVKVRYKDPDGVTSRAMELPLTDAGLALENASSRLRFATAVAGFGLILQGSKFAGRMNLDQVASLARAATCRDIDDQREFLAMVERASELGAGKAL